MPGGGADGARPESIVVAVRQNGPLSCSWCGGMQCDSFYGTAVGVGHNQRFGGMTNVEVVGLVVGCPKPDWRRQERWVYRIDVGFASGMLIVSSASISSYTLSVDIVERLRGVGWLYPSLSSRGWRIVQWLAGWLTSLQLAGAVVTVYILSPMMSMMVFHAPRTGQGVP
jgi:hypothetical protein